MYQSFDGNYWKNIPYVPRYVAVALGNISHVAANCIQTTMCVLIFSSMLLFQVLKTRMESTSVIWNKKDGFQSQDDRSYWSQELEKWRQHHDIVCIFVERINRCFGPCLLITLSYTFGIFVKYSCQSLTQFQSGDKGNRLIAYLLMLMIVSVRILIILYVSHNMQVEVSRQ